MGKTFDWIALTIMIIGAFNWGLIGLFGFDLVTTLFSGSLFFIARAIFTLVGIAGIYSLTIYSKLSPKRRTN